MTFALSPLVADTLRQLIDPDLRAARDDRDLRRRLAHLGYDFCDHGPRRVLVTLPHGVPVMELDQHPARALPRHN